MALTIISTSLFNTGTVYSAANDQDGLYVLRDAVVGSTDFVASAVSIDRDSVNVKIDGTVYSNYLTVHFLTGGTNSRLEIGRTGVVTSFEASSANAAVAIQGAGSGVFNQGEISGIACIGVYSSVANGEVVNLGVIKGTSGVQFYQFGLDQRLVNHGSIIASGNFDGTLDSFEGKGVLASSPGTYILNSATGIISSLAVGGSGLAADITAGGLRVENFGQISATNGRGVDLGSIYGGAEDSRIINWGSISGAQGSYLGSGFADTLINRGTLTGDVDMGGGDDLFDGRGGIVLGTASLGAGLDTVRGNEGQAEVFDGGADSDLIDFRFGRAVTVALDGSFDNAGAALGDEYTGFERVTGSAQGDMIRGNGVANSLNGLAGNDTIDGAEGADVLRGGTGADLLTGGLGNDLFRFNAANEFGDVITDFSNIAGDNDRFQISVSVGGGLVAGTLAAGQFQQRADNLAQDADDRFIFRTTDRTLWFDADGNGAVTAVMVADLQAGATLSAGDILLV